MAYDHKAGDVFDLSGQITITEGGSPIADMTGWTGASQLRTLEGALIANLTFTWLDAAERTCRLYATNTGSWPIGVAQFDIRFTSPSGDKISSGVQTVQIVRGVTQDVAP